MSLDTDVLILGGGCAGLSLAAALAQQAPRMRVLTLEQREAYTRDRTWCFWNSTEHPFASGVTHRWDQWRVQADGTQARQRSSRFCYQHLPADLFYQLAQDILAGANQQLQLGTQVGTVSGHAGDFLTETTHGLVRSRWVFDARTPVADEVRPTFVQRFEGWHVRTEQSCFDPDCVDLMDFQPETVTGRATFFYVLPFTRHEALVEITYLDLPGLVPEQASERLSIRMAQLCPSGDYEVVYRETGALPMGADLPVGRQTIGAIPIGARGGRIKASSGYAFQRIQRQSGLFATALANGQPLPHWVEPRYYHWLDRVFLVALQRNPQRIASYFLRLFRSVRPEALIPFLSETAGPLDVCSTMLALPHFDFIMAATQAFGATR